MRLNRVVGTKIVHMEKDLPPIINQFIHATGRKGVACDTDYGFVFFVERWEGKKEDVTCPKCIALITE